MNVIKHTRNFQLLAASSCLLPIYHIGENALFVGFRAFRLRSGQLCQHRAGGAQARGFAAPAEPLDCGEDPTDDGLACDTPPDACQ